VVLAVAVYGLVRWRLVAASLTTCTSDIDSYRHHNKHQQQRQERDSMFGSGLLLEIVDDDQLLSLIVEEKNALIELLRLWESQNLLIGAIIPRLLKDVDSICMSLSLYPPKYG
jgi:hypothetical protein